MTGQPRWQGRNRIDLPLLAQPAGAVEAGATADATLVGRLTDLDGVAVAGATILVFRTTESGWPSGSIRDDEGEPMIRSDDDQGLDAGAGALLSGLATRLTGGVGLSF